jgi:hypothetical protein
MGLASGKVTYASLVLSNVQLGHDIAGLVRVSDILKGLGRVLSCLVQQHLLSTGMLNESRSRLKKNNNEGGYDNKKSRVGRGGRGGVLEGCLPENNDQPQHISWVFSRISACVTSLGFFFFLCRMREGCFLHPKSR